MGFWPDEMSKRGKKRCFSRWPVKISTEPITHISHSSFYFLLPPTLQLNIHLGEFIIKYRYACLLIKKPILRPPTVYWFSDAYFTNNSKLSWFGKLHSDWLTLCNCTFISPSGTKIPGWHYKHFWGWNIDWVCQCLQGEWQIYLRQLVAKCP